MDHPPLAASRINNSLSYEELELNWSAYIERREIRSGIEPHIVRSWKRCSPRLNPLSDIFPTRLSAGILAVADLNASIRDVGRRVMEDVFEFIEGSNAVVLIVNSTGYIIDMIGDATMLAIASEYALTRGVLLAESHVGTNAFALALAEGVPVQVRGPEHFLKKLHKLASTAAPIFDLNGRPLGAIGLLNHFEECNLHTLGLAMSAAHLLMSQRALDVMMAEQNSQIAQLNAILGAVSEGVMVWNMDGRLIHMNGAAEQALSIPGQAVLGKRFRDFISLPPWLEEAIQEREQLTKVNARVRVGNRAIDLIISLSYLQNTSKMDSVIVTLHKEVDLLQISQNRPIYRPTSINENLPGNSMPIRRVRGLARTASAARASVLIRGERGTGKNVLATAIHNDGPRRDEPFIFFACASTPPGQMIEEMLGLGEGISNQAPWGKPGKFEMAQGGTIYFQDVEGLTLEAQAVLLDALELGIVQYKFNHRPIAVDSRVIASSSFNLEKMISEGLFRPDLYYRLSTFEIILPPLRDRPKDLPAIVDEMIKRLSRQVNEPIRVSDKVIEIFEAYNWPGNLRELEAVLRLAASQIKGQEEITPEHLPEFVFHPSGQEKTVINLSRISSLHEIEREAVIESARYMRGNVSQMARSLGISRTTLWRKLREFQISVEDFRIPRV